MHSPLRRRRAARDGVVDGWMAVVRKLAPEVLEWSWEGAGEGVDGARRLALGLMRDSRVVRLRFPRGLVEGREGGYARWLVAKVKKRVGEGAVVNVEDAFRRAEEERVIEHLLHDYSLWRKQPRALLPEGRQEIGKWLFKQGVPKFGFSVAEVLWFLQSAAVREERLGELYRLITPGAWGGGKAGEVGRGVNVLGHFTFRSGLQRSAVASVMALRHLGEEVSLRNLPILRGREPSLRGVDYLGEQCKDLTLVHATPDPYYRNCFTRAGWDPGRAGRLIVHYAWELPELPEGSEVLPGARELWAYSRFVAEALAPWGLPTEVIPPVVAVSAAGEGAVGAMRARLGVGAGEFMFLYVFDLSSTVERKNPEAVLAAFREAARASDRAVLVLKVARAAQFGEHYERLRVLAEGLRVVWITEMFSDEDIDALMAACDCYVSLHRAEGFGFTMAEAMLHGKPVIATGYSGNLEFMTGDNSLLVGWEPCEVPEGVPCYPPGLRWADPSVAEAAARMRDVMEDREAARALGERARLELADQFSLEEVARRVGERLAAVRSAQ